MTTNPRSNRVRRIILDAAAALLVREGARAVTVVRIAEESGVARTTVYRHFRTSGQLLLGAIDRVVTPHVRTELTGNTKDDLLTALSGLRARLERRPFRRVFIALADHANEDEEFVAAQRRFVDGVLEPIQHVLEAAIESGAVSQALDVETATARLAGPLFHQHVMRRADVSASLIKEAVAQFLDAHPEGRGSKEDPDGDG